MKMMKFSMLFIAVLVIALTTAAAEAEQIKRLETEMG